MYLYQRNNWPEFTWNTDVLLNLLVRVRSKQAMLKGYMEALGFIEKDLAAVETLTQDVIKSSEIEGEILDPQQVRSSIARRLGVDIAGLVQSDRKVDGVVEMVLDATQNYNKPLSKERLFGWQEALFPAGKSGMYNIITGAWRDDSTGPMQIVSGALGKEKVHYVAPPAQVLDKEMARFIKWVNHEGDTDAVIKAAIAHLWFVVIHPFEDGNGRIARALADMLLARADNDKNRFYSMSAQIRIERKGYYDILQKTDTGTVDITNWLTWFLNCLDHALDNTQGNINRVMAKTRFWEKHNSNVNERQRLMINKLLAGFDGNLNTSKWAKIAKCSPDTALRDIEDLIQKKILKKGQGGGRSTHYVLT